ERTPIPAPSSSRAVPPVETISMPRSASPRAKSISPRLSDTVRSARRTWTSPGSVTVTVSESAVAIAWRLLIDDDVTGGIRVDPHRPGGDQADRPRQEPVLDLVDSSLDGGDVTRIGKNLERFLQDDRPGVDRLFHEVEGHPHHLNAVGEGLVDRPDGRARPHER